MFWLRLGDGMNSLNLGAGIRKLREEMNMLQEDLAGVIGISRPAIVNIESGKRKISADELILFAKTFGLTLDQLVNPDLRPVITVDQCALEEDSVKGERISIPQKNYKKFKEVLLYILTEIGARPNVGQTVLYKLLYFIDFNYYEKYEEQIMGAVYIKNHYGPTPVHFKRVIEEMEEAGDLQSVSLKYFDYRQTKYLPKRLPDLSLFSANELLMIDEVISELGNRSAGQLSDYSHGDVPWISAADGEQLNYEMVFYRTQNYSVREYSIDD